MIRCVRTSLVKLSLYSISLASYCLSSHAQLSGEVDLGGGSSKSEAAPAANIKEITVTGIGATLESAEKQALASAIRQAVGAYMDSKTIVENEEVIQDRILSVSNAFVEKYEVVGQPKKTSDGLIEITILAKVKTNQVVQALKENNLISGEVAGQNLWAEASTKVMNAQDAVAMLEAKLPEFIKGSVTITPLDKNLKPNLLKNKSAVDELNTTPTEIQQIPSTEKARLIWLLELKLNNNYYSKFVIPELIRLLNIISESSPELVTKEIQTDTVDWTRENFRLKAFRARKGLLFSNYKFKIINPISLNNDLCSYHQYNFDINDILNFSSGEMFPFQCYVSIELLNSEHDIISTKSFKVWQPFDDTKRNEIGPLYDVYEVGNNLITPYYDAFSIELPLHLIKEIKFVKIKLDTQDIKIKLAGKK